MPLKDNPQPEVITINDWLRLRKYDGNYQSFLPAYQDPYVYQNSEGIFDESKIPNLDYVKRMCEYLSRVGELYYIEAKDGEVFVPVGDVTVKEENPPICIWKSECRSRGVGTLVMQTVIRRLRQLGYTQITGSTVYQWNLPSQRMHEKLGFQKTGEDEKEITYALELITEVVAALIWDGNRFLICQRPESKARGLLWEFVGGKVEPGETKEEALIRECREELAVTLSVGEVFTEVIHQYPDITIRLTLFHASIAQGQPQLLEHVDMRWITPQEISQYQFCPADQEILKKLREDADGVSSGILSPTGFHQLH